MLHMHSADRKSSPDLPNIIKDSSVEVSAFSQLHTFNGSETFNRTESDLRSFFLKGRFLILNERLQTWKMWFMISVLQAAVSCSGQDDRLKAGRSFHCKCHQVLRYKPTPLYEYLFIWLFYIVAYFLLYISQSLYNRCYKVLKLVYWLFCKKTNKGPFKVLISSGFFFGREGSWS